MTEHQDERAGRRCPWQGRRCRLVASVARIGIVLLALIGLGFAWPPGWSFWLGLLAVGLLLRWLPHRAACSMPSLPSAVQALSPTGEPDKFSWCAESPVVLYRVDLAAQCEDSASDSSQSADRDDISANLLTVFGHDPAAISQLIPWWQAHLHPEDVASVLAASDYDGWPEEGRIRRYRFLHGDGQYVWVADSARVLRDEFGQPRWVVGSMINIESQIQMRLQLEREEQRYRLITQNLQEVIALHAPDGRLLWLSPSTRHLLGYKPEQLLAEPVERWLHPEDWQRWLALRAQGSQAWVGRNLVFKIRLSSGEWRWMETCFTRFTGDFMVGAASLQSVTRDVHERVLIEQRLRESEQLYRSIFDHVDALIFVVGVEPDGEFMFLANNQRHEKLTGFTPNQYSRRRPHELLPQDLADWVTQNYRECVIRRAPVHYVQFGEWGGVQHYLDMVLTPIFDADGAVSLIVGLGTELTEQRQKLLALRQTSHRLLQVTEVAQLGYFAGDLAHGALTWSDNLRQWFAVETSGAAHAAGLVPPALAALAGLIAAVAVPDRPRLIGLLSDLARGVLIDIRRDVLMRRQDGKERWMSWSVKRLNEAPAVLRIEGSLQDVTERVAAEHAAARSSRRDAAVLRTVAEGIIGVDAEGRISFANPAARQLLGLIGQSFMGRPASVVYDNDLPELNFLTALTDGRSRTGVQSEFYRQGEGRFPVRWSVTVLPDEFDVEKNGLVVVFSDISEMKQHEAALERLATTDELTGLANRRAFIDRLDEEFSRAGRYALPVSVLMLDIDHFKQVNDTHGHAAGDALLRAFAGLLREKLRRPDICGRLGGEEFAVLLPNTPCRGAFEIADRLRQAVAAMRVPIEDGEVGCTVSIGVCDLMENVASASEALSRADRALYRAKSSGRNRVCGCEATKDCVVTSGGGADDLLEEGRA